MPRRLAQVALVALTLELLLQGLYRLTTGDMLWRRTALSIFDRDETRCFRLKPNLAYRHRTPEYDVMIYTNAQGLRTDEARRALALDKPSGVRRILFLGPSYAFGWGSSYEQSYAALIEQGVVHGLPVEIVNLGTPGQSPGPQLCWLRSVGHRLLPDLVIQTVVGHPGALGDDCPEAISCPLVEDGFLLRSSAQPIPRWQRRVTEVAKRSALVFYAWYLERRYLTRSASPGDAVDIPREVVSTRSGDPRLLWTRYERYVESVRRYAGQATQVAFVFVPPAYVVHAEDLARHPGISPAAISEIPALAARLQGDLERHGLLFVDATPALRRAGARGRAYYWLDTHLTPLGNRVVAEAILERIARAVPSRAGAGLGRRRRPGRPAS